MKLYQVVGIFVIFSLAFPDCHGGPSLKAKALGKGYGGVLGTVVATPDAARKHGKSGLDAKEER